ncbi:MAG: hypothetical protein AAF604_08175 [Acidobacteriota bacterium]
MSDPAAPIRDLELCANEALEAAQQVEHHADEALLALRAARDAARQTLEQAQRAQLWLQQLSDAGGPSFRSQIGILQAQMAVAKGLQGLELAEGILSHSRLDLGVAGDNLREISGSLRPAGD